MIHELYPLAYPFLLSLRGFGPDKRELWRPVPYFQKYNPSLKLAHDVARALGAKSIEEVFVFG
jgi:hypothetical protein